MPQYIILSQSDTTARALGAWLELLGQPPLKCLDRVIVQKEQTVGGKERAILAYENLVRKIEKTTADASGSIPLNEIVILVDSVKATGLNPLAESGWDNLVAMLILTFPEIHWVFGVIGKEEPSKEPDGKPISITDNHSLSTLLTKPRRDPLFDATGLRHTIKKVLSKTPDGSGVPLRNNCAAAIDDESSYALFHAYTAYRFGYRADAVRSWALMHDLFGENIPKVTNPQSTEDSPEVPKTHNFDLLLEDVNLNFPDKPGKVHLSCFRKLDNKSEPGRAHKDNCPMLNEENEKSKFRIIVTSGHSGTDRNNMRDNLDFIKEYQEENECAFVLKPVGGMFDLWEKALLFKRLNHRKNPKKSGSQKGQAPDFNWPPLSPHDAEKSGGHSAPGKLMLIAQHLIRRADALVESANTIEECIRGAVLATDALELLCFQTPTLALQALSLKHEYEVKAEVAFLGVGHHFLLEPRLREMQRDVKVASQYFQKGRRVAAELDTLVSIGNRLVLIFRKAGQFDEESACMVQVRKWHRELQRKQTRNVFTLVGHGVMTYVEWLLVSPRRFVLAFVGWYLLLAALWYVLEPFPIEENDPLWFALTVSFNTFVAASPEKAVDTASFILNGLGLTTGLFHLGVFIAYLYSIISRK